MPVLVDPRTGQLIDPQTGEVLASPQNANGAGTGSAASTKPDPNKSGQPSSSIQAIEPAAKRGTMPSPSDREAIKITAEDLANVAIPESAVTSPVTRSSGAKVYGTINETAEQFVTVPAERGSILAAGLVLSWLGGIAGRDGRLGDRGAGLRGRPRRPVSCSLGKFHHSSADHHSDVHRVWHFRKHRRTVGAQGAIARSPGLALGNISGLYLQPHGGDHLCRLGMRLSL